MRNSFTMIVAMSMTLILGACSEDPKPTTDGDGTELVIGPDGGIISLGNWTISCPEGATDKEFTLSFGVPDSYPASDKLTELIAINSSSPELNQPCVIQYALADDGREEPLNGMESFLAVAADTKWLALGSSVHEGEEGIVTAYLPKFGIVGVLPADATGLVFPPMLNEVIVSTHHLPADVASEVTWEWTYRVEPSLETTCQLDQKVGTITNGATLSMTVSEATPYALTCENAAGRDSATVSFDLAVAPVIQGFRASPPFALSTATLPVTWVWEFANEALPTPTCAINHGVGEVYSGAVSGVLLNSMEQTKTFTLTCSNTAGSDSASFAILRGESLFLPVTVTPQGGIYQLGHVTLDVPARAVSEPVELSVAFDTAYQAAANLATLPLSFTPESLWFDTPATLTIPYDETVAASLGIVGDALNRLQISSLSSNTWTGLYSVVDTSSKTVSARLNHFSSKSVTISETKGQPLSKDIVTLNKREEIAIVIPGADAVTMPENDSGQVLDDASGGYDELGRLPGNLCVGHAGGDARLLEMLPGDFNGDGKKELAVLCNYNYNNHMRSLSVKILANTPHGFRLVKTIDVLELGEHNAELQADESYYDGDIAVVNVDGGAAENLVLVGSFGKIDSNNRINWRNKSSGKLWLFDNLDNNMAVMNSHQFHLGQGTHRDFRVDGGDLDGDGLANEIVVAMVVYIDGEGSSTAASVYRYNPSGSRPSLLRSYYDIEGSFIFRPGRWRPNVVVADFDGDSRDEIAFIAVDDTNAWIEVYNWTTRSTEKQGRYAVEKLPRKGKYFWGSRTPKLTAGDFDGNGTQNIAFALYNRFAFLEHERGWVLGYYFPSMDDPTTDGNNSRGIISWSPRDMAHIATGDTNEDNRDEVFYLYRRDGAYRLQRWQKTLGSEIVFRQPSDHGYWGRPYYDINLTGQPLVAIGDFDGDNTIVEFTNDCVDHDRSPPQVMVVGAGAPTYIDMASDDNCTDGLGSSTSCQTTGYTEYGVESSNGSETSKTVGLSMGVTLSFDNSNYFRGWFGLSTSLSLEKEFERTNTQSETVTRGTNYRMSAAYNGVVFARTTWKSCKYRILAHHDPDLAPRADGSYHKITIDQPSQSLIYNWNADDFYMEYPNEPRFVALDSRIKGEPFSYPDPGERDDMLAEFDGWKSDTMTLTTNQEYTEAYITLNTQQTSTESLTISSELNVGVMLAGFSAEASVGYKNTNAYSVSVGESTSYKGAVGGFPTLYCFRPGENPSQPASCNDHCVDDYFWGLFVYNYIPDTGRPYQVIDYWVEAGASSQCGE